MIESGIEGAVEARLAGRFGGLLALSIGMPRDSAITYETRVKANRVLVMACRSAERAERARAVLRGVQSIAS